MKNSFVIPSGTIPPSPLSIKDNLLYFFAFTGACILYSFISFSPSANEFIQMKWHGFLHSFPFDDPMCTGTVIFSTVIYWVHALVLSIFQISKYGRKILHLKIQPEKTVSVKLWIKAAAFVLFNQLVVGSIFGIVLRELYKIRLGLPYLSSNTVFLNHFLDRPPASLFEWMYSLLFYIVFEEIGFYYLHRLFHKVPFLYRNIHKKHHEFTSPIAVAAIYCHPIEHFFVNLMPLFSGCLVLGTQSLAIVWSWTFLAIINTVNSHCGYVFPGFPSPLAHDFHHYRFTSNYGIMGILDSFHGTDSQYKLFLKRAILKGQKEEFESF